MKGGRGGGGVGNKRKKRGPELSGCRVEDSYEGT